MKKLILLTLLLILFTLTACGDDEAPDEPFSPVETQKEIVEPSEPPTSTTTNTTSTVAITTMVSVFQESLDDYAPVITEERGNTNGNIINNGLAAIDGDWIFYRDDDACLYKRNINTGEEVFLDYDVHIRPSINVYKNMVYYIRKIENTNDYDYFKIGTDGTGRTSLGITENNINRVTPQHLHIVDDWIYFYSFKAIHKIHIDGTGREEITEVHDTSMIYTEEFCIEDGWIYYLYNGFTEGIYKIRTDGTGRKRVVEYINGNSFCVSDGWIYYVNNFAKISRVRVDGTHVTEITDNHAKGIYHYDLTVGGNRIFSFDYSEKNIDSISFDGREITTISKTEDNSNINIVGDYIYYHVNRTLNIIKTDGSETLYEPRKATPPRNWGRVIADGDWIYYIGEDGIYKSREDLSEKELVSAGNNFYSIIIKNNILYYSNDEGLHRQNTDGTGKLQLSEHGAEFIELVGDWLFCLDTENGFYTVRITDSEFLWLSRYSFNPISSMVADGEWVYIYRDEKPVYKARIFYDEPEFVDFRWSNEEPQPIQQTEWEYYSNFYDDDKLYRSRSDGTNEQKLSDDRVHHVNVCGDYVYYRLWNGGNNDGGLYRIRTNGTAREKVG